MINSKQANKLNLVDNLSSFRFVRQRKQIVINLTSEISFLVWIYFKMKTVAYLLFGKNSIKIDY